MNRPTTPTHEPPDRGWIRVGGRAHYFDYAGNSLCGDAATTKTAPEPCLCGATCELCSIERYGIDP